MNTKSVRVRIVVTALALASLAASRPAAAETLWFEAEDGKMTSPLLIKDQAAASGGAFVEVQAGSNSTGSAPALGRSCYTFFVNDAGDYRLWGRVMAPTDGDDSFWVSMDGGSWINWNQIALGGAWHWDHVHSNSTPTQPAIFPLASGDHNLCVAYREDGTKLDLLLLTDDSIFDPRTPPSLGDPPADARLTPGTDTLLLTWTHVPGAERYTIFRREDVGGSSYINYATDVTDHSLVDTVTSGYCYKVKADFPTSSQPSQEVCNQPSATLQRVVEAESLAHTSPLQVNASGNLSVIPGNNSTASAPTTGVARLDLRLATPELVKIWVMAVAPDASSDSFWVRVDGGSWIKWNEIDPQDPCGWDDVHNSDAGGAVSQFNLAAGFHRIELAYREDGTELDRILVTDNLSTTRPSGCFD
jgi:hypothetical protein